MLSICIPVYNYKISSLATELARQCKLENIDFEIIILEDGSTDEFIKLNSGLASITNLKHIIQKNNQGRSATRNRLAKLAIYDKILFIDCDSEIPSNQYIKQFIYNKKHDVVCGGTTYTEKQKDVKYSLRLNYGFSREMIPATERNKNSNKSFTTNNFMISASIFDKLQFREFLTAYGHEDSLFGFELLNENVKIHHIDNPVIHIGLETNAIFLEKTYRGLENLIIIENNTQIDSSFIKEIKIVGAYFRIKKLYSLWIIRLIYSIFKNAFKNHIINSSKPILFIFDFMKIGYYTNLKHYKNKSINNN